MSIKNKEKYGQFFTKNNEVLEILTSLISPDKKNKKILEPSCGEGFILKKLEELEYENVLGIEIDNTLQKINNSIPINYQSFFSYNNKVDVIIGNPPFVQYKNIENNTKKEIEIFSEYSKLGNLYYLFIHYSIDLLNENGELIFIVPKEWIFTTSARPLRKYIYKNGIISHFIDLGEQRVFDDANLPSLCIFKFVKQNQDTNYYKINYSSHILGESLSYQIKQLYIDDDFNILIGNKVEIDKIKNCPKKVKDVFNVKVGLVTGADNIFNITNNLNFLKIKDNNIINILTTKGIQKYIYIPNNYQKNEINPKILLYLDKNKDYLKNKKDLYKYTAYRNIKTMEEYIDYNKIFVYQKTRKINPFFIDNSIYFNGALLGLFPIDKEIDLNKYLDYFNSEDFLEIMKIYNLYSNNKITIQQATLEKLPILI